MLNGRFDPHGPPVVTVMDASAVVALGRLALHTGDGRQVRQTSEIAKTMLNESTPGVRRHAAWLLSLQATADGDPRQAHQWLCAMGETERTHVLSRIWPDLADEPQMVRIALAVGDRELADSAVADANRRAELSPAFRCLPRSRPTPAGCSTGYRQAVRGREPFRAKPPIACACRRARGPRPGAPAGGTADSGIDALRRPSSFLRGPGRPGMRRDSEAAFERSVFAAAWRRRRSRRQDGRR